jgi:dihydrofolate reductase
MKIIIIAAIAANGIIGCTKRGLPWHIPEDFKHFKETTMGFPVIMGKTTWLEFKKPLPGRTNIVLSYDDEPPVDGFLFFKSLDEALKFCEAREDAKVFIIGGKMVFEQGLKVADELVLSHLNFESDGDIAFPRIDARQWNVVAEKKGAQFTVKYYTRSRGTSPNG